MVPLVRAEDAPVVLSTNMRVSAKFRGAYCEAKIVHVDVDVTVQVCRTSDSTLMTVPLERVEGNLRVGETVYVRSGSSISSPSIHGTIRSIKDNSNYTVLFNDGDQIVVKRRSLLVNQETPISSCYPSPQGTFASPSKYSRSMDDVESRTHESGMEGHNLSAGDVVLAKSHHGFFPAVVINRESDNQSVMVKSFCTNEEIKVSCTDVSILDQKRLDQMRSMLPGFDLTSVEDYLRTRRSSRLWPDVEDLDINLPSSDDECISNKDYFLANLINFLEASGKPMSDMPTVNGIACDLCKLYRIVDKNGGCHRVTRRNLWKDIHIALGLPVGHNDGVEIKQIYNEYLLSFYEMNRKLGSPTVAPDRRTLPRESKSNQRLFKPSSSALRSRRLSGETAQSLRSPKLGNDCSKLSSFEQRSASSIRRKSVRQKAIDAGKNIKKVSSVHSSRSPADMKFRKVVRSARKSSSKSNESVKTNQYSRLRPRFKTSKPARSSRRKRTNVANTFSRSSSNDSSSCSRYSHVSSSMLQSISLPDKFTIDQIERQSFVKVLWSNTESEREVYKAKILEKDTVKDLVYVHYVGWNSRYDQWITLNRILAINCDPPGRNKASRSVHSQDPASTTSSRTIQKLRSFPGQGRPSRRKRARVRLPFQTARLESEKRPLDPSSTDQFKTKLQKEEQIPVESDSPISCTVAIKPQRGDNNESDNYSVYSSSDLATEYRDCLDSSEDNYGPDIKISEDSELVERKTPSDHKNLIRLDGCSSPESLRQRLEEVLPNRLRITREELLSRLGIDPCLLDENASTSQLQHSLSTQSLDSSQSGAFSDDDGEDQGNVSISGHDSLAATYERSTAGQDLQRALVAIGNRADLLAGSRFEPPREDGDPDKRGVCTVSPFLASQESRSRLFRRAASNLSAGLVRVEAMYQVVKEQYDIKLAEWEAKYSQEGFASGKEKAV